MKKLFLIILSLVLCFNPVFSGDLKAAAEAPDLKKILEEFDAYAQKTQKQWNIPGMAVCIVVGDEVVYKKSFGVRKVKIDDKVNNQTIFQIASCTKAFTAALAAMLVDRGHVSWDDKVIKYMPDFRLDNKKISDEMTIEDLLAQYSGLPSYSQHLMMLFGYEPSYILSSMRYIKQTGEFRKSYSYQNNLYLLMGEIIKKATGKPWDYNIREHIFKPLAMHSSSADYKSYLKAKNRAVGHFYSGGVLKAIPDDLPYNDWPYVFAPAGGINSNIDDMSEWLLFIINDAASLGGQLISADNFNTLFKSRVFINTATGNKRNFYCLGWKSMEYSPENILWHAGTTDGSGAYVSFMKDNKIGMVVLMNLPNGRMAEALAKKFYDAYLQNPEINWSALKLEEANKAHKKRTPKARPEIIVPPLDLKKYAGIYNNVLYGDAEVKLEGGVLKFSAGPKKVWITLKHFNAHTFDGTGVSAWRFKRPMFIFKVYEKTNVRGLIVEDMTDGTDPLFRKIK